MNNDLSKLISLLVSGNLKAFPFSVSFEKQTLRMIAIFIVLAIVFFLIGFYFIVSLALKSNSKYIKKNQYL